MSTDQDGPSQGSSPRQIITQHASHKVHSLRLGIVGDQDRTGGEDLLPHHQPHTEMLPHD